jgi:cytochrome c5
MNWVAMKTRHSIAAVFILLAFMLAVGGAARAGSNTGSNKDASKSAASAATTHAAQDDTLRLEGERRFHANCGRCHAAPPKFSPRMVATIIRHMRVRATITDEEARLILHYMSE